MTKRLSVQEATACFGDLLKSVSSHNAAVIIEEEGQPVAVLVTPEQWDRYQRLTREAAWAAIDQIGERNAHLDPDEVYREVTEVVEEVRRERHERR